MSGMSDATAAVGNVASANQFTLLQDGYHYSSANYEFVGNRQTLTALRDAGVKNIVIEYEKAYQTDINNFSAGKISRQEFVHNISANFSQQNAGDRARTSNGVADMVEFARNNGMQVRALDTHGKYGALFDSVTTLNGMTSANPNLKDLNVATLDRVLEASGNNQKFKDARAALHEMNLDPDTKVSSTQFNQSLSPRLLQERTDQDRQLAGDIKAVSGNDKTAVLFGVLHGAKFDGKEGRRDLDENLGPNTGKVLLTPSSTTFQSVLNRPDLKLQELPATVVYTDASKLPGRQVEAEQNRNNPKIGGELPAKGVTPADYGTLKPPPVYRPGAPEEISR